MKVSDGVKDILGDDTAFYGLLIVLVGITAYGLGLQTGTSARSTQTAAAAIEMIATEPQNIKNETSSIADEAKLVASKNGTKYHYLWCPGASQIKEENKLFFATIEAARAAGYSPAANCEGLE